MRPSPLRTLLLTALLAAAAVGIRLAATRGGLDAPRDGVEWELRGLRAAAGCAVGGALALAGVFLQSLLRNPLAAPSLLGLTAGAGFGVVASIYVKHLATGAVDAYGSHVLPATAGALGSLGIVYLLAQRRGRVDPPTLLLLGVAVAVLCSAGTTFLQHLLPNRDLAMGLRWMLGSLHDDATWSRIGLTGGLCLGAVGVGVALAPAMDAAACADDEARAMGVPLPAVRGALFALSGLLVAGAVLLAGPIGFVGLLCPHAVRFLAGPGHRTLVPAAALLGAATVVLADAAVRMIDLGAGRMPIGVLTALLGGPLFIVLLRARRGAL